MFWKTAKAGGCCASPAYSIDFAALRPYRRAAMSETATLIPLDDVDPALIEALLDRAFEPERRTRTAYRLRAGLDWLPALSFAAIDAHDQLVGAIQCWPLALTAPGGKRHPLIMGIDRRKAQCGQPIQPCAQPVCGAGAALGFERAVKQRLDQGGIDVVERDQGGGFRHNRAPIGPPCRKVDAICG